MSMLDPQDAPTVSKPRSPTGFSQTPVNDPSSVLDAPQPGGNKPGPQAGASRFHVGLRTPTRQRLLPAQQPPTPLSRPLLFSWSRGGVRGWGGGGGRATRLGRVEQPQAQFHPQHRPGPRRPHSKPSLESPPQRRPDFLQPAELISPSERDHKCPPHSNVTVVVRPHHPARWKDWTHLTDGLSIHLASSGGREQGEGTGGALGRAETCHGALQA